MNAVLVRSYAADNLGEVGREVTLGDGTLEDVVARCAGGEDSGRGPYWGRRRYKTGPKGWAVGSGLGDSDTVCTGWQMGRAQCPTLSRVSCTRGLTTDPSLPPRAVGEALLFARRRGTTTRGTQDHGATLEIMSSPCAACARFEIGVDFRGPSYHSVSFATLIVIDRTVCP